MNKNINVSSCFVYLLLVSTLVEATKTAPNNVSSTFQSHIVKFCQKKYDVFVSFRGTDIRRGLLSHLTEAFRQNQIVFFVDNKLKKGDEIAPSLLDAIETSLISVVIFSQNYAFSPWCLDELVKIDECRKKDGHVLLPVFYDVEPTTVRHQNGTYANAFHEHEKNYDLSRVLLWRSALNESGNIFGFHPSSMPGGEAVLVKEIVQSVLRELDQIHMHKLHSKGLVGIGEQILHVESLLQANSKDVRAIGIWGMPGIGKTTIAKQVYNRLCSNYEGCYFKANVREESGRRGIMYLKEELYSTLLGQQNLKMNRLHVFPDFVMRRLRCMKVLVVLDDVSDRKQLDILIETLDWFGNGSRIIITTRDKQVLANKVVDNDIYEVKALEFDDSFRLFNLNAFEQSHPKMEEYHELSKKLVNYAKGIPLVLKELGHLLGGKDKKTWERQLERLTEVPMKKVHDAVRLSYDDLDRGEKKMLLVIACFSDGLHLKVDNIQLLLKVDNIQLLLKDHGYNFVDVELESLKNKGLLRISQDKVVSMHSIIQVTAREIFREESIQGKQIQLLEPNDNQLLKHAKGSEAIYGKGIKHEKLLLAHCEFDNLPESIKIPPRLRHLDLWDCRKLQSLPVLPSLLKTLDASDCISLKTVAFPSTDLQMLNENKKRVAFWNCLKLDEPSLQAIELNAHINMMNFALQHVSTFVHDYDSQATYVYPGSSVPEWLEYRTTSDSLTVDLSFTKQHSFDHLGFIFGFIVPEIALQGSILRFNIAIGEGEDDNIQVYLDRTSDGIQCDHVYLLCNQNVSRYLSSRFKNQSTVEIRVTVESGTVTSEYVPLKLLKGFGISPINTSQDNRLADDFTTRILIASALLIVCGTLWRQTHHRR